MTSTIKVNNIQNQCGANIANKCGSTITLGASGDTITLTCGASQTGFGRTGTVDWDTTAKTASFTAVSGNGYFVNTTSGAITVTLPATPSAGDIVAIADYASTANTNNITVGRNSSNINGSASDIIISANGKSITLVYVDGTQGWKITDNADQNTEGPAFITATGGTVTCCGDYKIHTFTSPGTFCVSSAGNPLGSSTVDYLVVAGGGGGSYDDGGGGGAGGYRESYCSTTSGFYTASPLATCASLSVTATGYPITVGAGGAGGPNGGPNGINGSNSIFSTITSAGGGGGVRSTPSVGNPGGSGGGGAPPANSGGTGNTPPVSPPQGNNGGAGAPGPNASGGGGGATAAGAAGSGGAPSGCGGNGGAGAGTLINPATGESGPGCLQYYAGGGGGGSFSEGGGTAGTGGIGGGGDGAVYPPTGCGQGEAGTANTGGGGGGGATSTGPRDGGAGGSGIVIIRYKYQ